MSASLVALKKGYSPSGLNISPALETRRSVVLDANVIATVTANAIVNTCTCMKEGICTVEEI